MSGAMALFATTANDSLSLFNPVSAQRVGTGLGRKPCHLSEIVTRLADSSPLARFEASSDTHFAGNRHASMVVPMRANRPDGRSLNRRGVLERRSFA
jgi:hypothetical protein